MSILSETHEMHLREASHSDIALLAQHHRKMFEEIWKQKGELLTAIRAGEVERAYVHKLKVELENGICKAWVIEKGGKPVASGAVTFVSFVPNPLDLSSSVAYLHSIYTEKSQRNMKCAQRIIHQAIQHCRSQGVKRILLASSAAGQPVYKKLGFQAAPEMMRLFLE